MVVPDSPRGVTSRAYVTRGPRPAPSEFLHGGEPLPERTATPLSSTRSRPDWRGWLALAWVLFWGGAYAFMVIQARSPRVLAWFRLPPNLPTQLLATLGWLLTGVFRS